MFSAAVRCVFDNQIRSGLGSNTPISLEINYIGVHYIQNGDIYISVDFFNPYHVTGLVCTGSQDDKESFTIKGENP
jgi:hypothetical protein